MMVINASSHRPVRGFPAIGLLVAVGVSIVAHGALSATVYAADTTSAVLVRLQPGLTPQNTLNGRWIVDGGVIDELTAAWGVTAVEPVLCEPAHNAALAHRYGLSRTYRFHIHAGVDLADVAAQLAGLPGVEVAEVDGPATMTATFPNDPFFPLLWGLYNTGQNGGTPGADIHAPDAWDLHTGSGTVTLAVLDTGAQTHPDLQLVGGWNTYENSANTNDGNGHGTFVAGVAGALGNNGVGVTGVSWNVPVMPMKCLSDGGEGSESTIAAAIVWAADHGADVANISLSTYSGTDTLHAAVLYAHDQGVVLVASVGANQSQGIGYPARYPECVAVGATGPHDDWASFSVYGPQIDVVAPGVDIYSTYLNSGYTWMSGVSFSTAYTSGLAALIRSYNPGLTNAQVEQILAESADDLGPPGWDDHFGWGRINAFHALQLASARGDLNCDGAVNFGDINPFVLYLSDFSAWQAAHPGCPAANGDINGDGVYGQGSLGDINPFVALLTGA